MPSLKTLLKAEDTLSLELAKKEDEDEVEMDDDMVGDYYMEKQQLTLAKSKKPGFQDLDKAFQGYLKGMSKGLSTWQGKKLDKLGKEVAADLVKAVKAAIKKLG